MLTGKQKRQLRAQANRIKASVTIGKDGVTDRVCQFIFEALGNKELVKVKVLDNNSDEFKLIVDRLSQLHDVEVAQVIGRTILLFRPLPEKNDQNKK